ncbi:unnamed protein product [Closterium sp. Naga37s-1]|nr:unnamed protein product [Closterium sp. Naga37s-1]
MDAAQGGRHTNTDGTTARPVLTEGLGRGGEVTEERGASRDEAAAAGGAGENDVVETELVAVALPWMAVAVVPEVAPAAVPAAETAVGPVPTGGSAAAFGGGSTSTSATPRVAQPEARETRPGADPEQTEEVVLSVSPAPVTAAVLAAVVSATTGEQGGAPVAEGATTAIACAAAANRQEHGQAEGEIPGPANDVSSGAVRAKSKKKLRAQPAPRRPGAGLGPGSLGPLMAWLLQGQPPSERTHRSGRRRCHSSLGSAGHYHVGSSKGRPYAVDDGGESGTRGHGLIGAGGRPGFARYGPRKARGGGRGGVARLGGAEIQARTGPWQERHDRPECSEAVGNGDEAGSAEENGDPELMCGEEPGPESEEVSLENEEEVRRGRNRARGAGEGVDGVTSQAVGVTNQRSEIASHPGRG